MTVGRPSTYSPEKLALAKAYLDKLPKDEVVHSIEGLSLAIGTVRSAIYEWREDEDKADFADIVEQILAKQGKKLVNAGLSGTFNSKITAVMMSKHGYREGHELTGPNGEKLYENEEAKTKAKSAISDYLAPDDTGDTGQGK